jgi:hypothetical protein
VAEGVPSTSNIDVVDRERRLCTQERYLESKKKIQKLMKQDPWFMVSLTEICHKFSEIGIHPKDKAFHEIFDLLMKPQNACFHDSTVADPISYGNMEKTEK